MSKNIRNNSIAAFIFRLSACATVLFLLLIFPFRMKAAHVDAKDLWNIKFNTDSIEYLLLNPEKILENPERIWKTDAAYRFVDRWHNSNNIPKTTEGYYTKWLAFLKEQAAVPQTERKNRPAYKFLNALKDKMPTYYEQAVPHIRGFLPQNDIAFEAGMYITAKTLPYAFMTNGNMVIDALNPQFNMDADAIFNTLTHETFHIGYGYGRYLRREMPLEDTFIYNNLLDVLQNEGIAVYVAFKAQSFFLSKGEQDYRLLQDRTEVKKRFQWVNDIFTTAEKKALSQDEISKKAWELGIMQRGYYIVGAFMARTLDEKLGRDALVRTVSEGPCAFIESYNEIAEKDLKIHSFKRPQAQPVWQQLKLAVFAEDNNKFERLAKELKDSRSNPDQKTQTQLVRIGYSQIYQRKWAWAIKAFTLGAELYPTSANSWDCLAEAYFKAGQLDQAEQYCQKALSVDPKFESSFAMLNEIKKLKAQAKK